ncbi:MAG: 1-acyl-sn-glycerol-3-phosphate acyltransferase [Akkermansia sp.]|nr:1-acyl-sn-glycerol-3-phosphate acyltransferase [Akkermansia sp.]
MEYKLPPMSIPTRVRCALAVMDYFLFGFGGLCVSVVLLILRPFFPARKERELGSKTLQYSWKLMCMLLRSTWNLRLHAPQKREMEQIRSSIIVANHPSLIDVVILTAIIPKCMLIVKPALMRWPFLRPILRRLCIVNNGDSNELLKHAQEAIEQGFNIIIFPEGTRTTPGKKNKLHRGAFHLAIRSGAPIVPIRIDTSQPFLTKEVPWWYVGEHCPVFTLTLHEPQLARQGEPAHPEAVRLCGEIASRLGLD